MMQSKIAPSVKIGQFIPIKEFKSEWAIFFAYHIHRFYLPTEVVIGAWAHYRPASEFPREARAFTTDLYVFKDHIVTYEWLLHMHKVIGEEFKGTYSCSDHLCLAEVWDDQGDEGHTDYHLRGYRFVPYKALEAHAYGDQRNKFPDCMLYQMEDER